MKEESTGQNISKQMCRTITIWESTLQFLSLNGSSANAKIHLWSHFIFFILFSQYNTLTSINPPPTLFNMWFKKESKINLDLIYFFLFHPSHKDICSLTTAPTPQRWFLGTLILNPTWQPCSLCIWKFLINLKFRPNISNVVLIDFL